MSVRGPVSLELGEDRTGESAPRIRPAVESDLPSIGEIEARSYSNPWHPDTFRSLLRRERTVLLVADHSTGGVVGYAVLWWVLDQGELANLAVREEYRGLGIGGALLDRTVELAGARGVQMLFLEVRMSNDPAFRLYTGRGFAQVSIRRDYYQDPREDARILLKILGPSPTPGPEPTSEENPDPGPRGSRTP